MKKFVSVLIVLSILVIGVYASTPSYPAFPSGLLTYTHVHSMDKAGTHFLLVTSEQPFRVSNDGNLIYYSGNNVKWLSCYIGATQWSESTWQVVLNPNGKSDVLNPDGLYYSSHDIYKLDGTLFFQPGELLEVAKMVVTKETVMFPILGMIVFLIGLIVISAALWKAWRFLLMQLRGV